VHRLLTSDSHDNAWSQRAIEQMGCLRQEHFFLKPDVDVILVEPSGGRYVWHTMAGNGVNLVLAQALERSGVEIVTCDDFSITLSFASGSAHLDSLIRGLSVVAAFDQFSPSLQLAESLKFHECLPTEFVMDIFRKRIVNVSHLKETLQRPNRFIVRNQ
jgi:hypothetical protein